MEKNLWVKGFAALAMACFCSILNGDVVLSEIMYHAPGSEETEADYVEVHNTAAGPADVSGYSLKDGIAFTFPESTVLEGRAYAIVCRSPDIFRAAYPAVAENLIFGDYVGNLSNSGEKLTLADAQGVALETVDYRDQPPWDFIADGFGASLERICFAADASLPENWRASPVPAEEGASGGTPATVNTSTICPPVFPARPRVYISEIMYHPVLEEALEDEHEFIEIHSEETGVVGLQGWRITGGIDFTFPAGASIAPGEYLVVAKNRVKLAAVAGYGLNEAGVLGDYARTLDNGGDTVSLLGDGGQGIDSLTYDDDAPWPAGADALGASEEWLDAALLPLENHRYRGISIERVSFDVPSAVLSNWAPSPIDGSTPGRANASARAAPLPAVSEILVSPAQGGETLIRAGQEVRVQVQFSPAAPQGLVELEYFVDLILTAGEETILKALLSDDGKGGDLIAADGVFSTLLPGHPDNTVLRYRVLADRGAGSERVAPRPSDPNAWNAYFVSPVITTETRVYQILISPAEWGRMWTGIQGGRVSGCTVSATWDRTYPAVFIHDGQVIDVRVRYQGSRYNRTNGSTISNWPFPRPTGGPSPLRALSWRISLPRYSQLDGLGDIVLNKNTQGCPGYNAGVGYRLFEAAGMPGSNMRYVRLHLNGGYYHYMVELERPGEEMMRRYHKEMAAKHPELPRERAGHVFKSAGCNCDEGPYGWGDERALPAACGFTKLERYAATYDRKTHGWAGYDEIQSLLEDLNTARRAGPEAIRGFFDARFDVDTYMNYVAIMNWSVPFDDMFQNHYLYQRLSDGKWIVFPWDLDQNFGEWKQANASFYMGEQGDPDNRSAWWNYLKDAFLKAFRDEYDDRLLLLNNTILHPENISRLLDEVTAAANPQEAQQSPAGLACSFPGRVTSFNSFAVQRYNLVNTRLAGVTVEAGLPQTVVAGSTVQFDARGSTPDPSPDAEYTWDNGMTGDYPTFIYQAPGAYTVTLSVTSRGIPFKDTVTITVLPQPPAVFQESGGQVVMEAENFHENERHAAQRAWWEAAATSPGYSGASYMFANATSRQAFLTKYATLAPELRYAIFFRTPGTYRVWLRALTLSEQADSAYVGFNGIERLTKYSHQFIVDPAAFQWSGVTRTNNEPQTLTIEQPGLYLFSLWMRESGMIIDKVLLTLDPGYTPQDLGPAESPQAPVGGPGTFIRGDADGNGAINITDPIAVLHHLFMARPILCEDSGDADDDGALSISDAIRILVYLFQGGAQPVPPFPDAGKDPTEDELPCGV